MDEAERNERCTIKSHGYKVVGHHKHDWFILLFLTGLELGLISMRPFYRFVSEGLMDDLKYPLKDNTVPTWSVPVSSPYKYYAKIFLVSSGNYVRLTSLLIL